MSPSEQAPTAAAPGASLKRQYVKFCELQDFDDPAIRERIREIAPGYQPDEELRRKFWEYAMLALFLEDTGRLHDRTEALSVGAGHEEVLFWLANKLAGVIATDIYGEGSFIEADETMLTDPRSFAPYPYREDHLEVRHMDARRLEFPDESFDVVFTLSSIEHFGSTDEVATAAREIGRVLRPGGHAFIVTECFLERHFTNSRILQTAIRAATFGKVLPNASPRRRALDVFTPEELDSLIVQPSGLRLMQPIEFEISPETLENVTLWSGPGQYQPATGKEWPHIVLQPSMSALSLQVKGAPFTSVALALEK